MRRRARPHCFLIGALAFGCGGGDTDTGLTATAQAAPKLGPIVLLNPILSPVSERGWARLTLTDDRAVVLERTLIERPNSCEHGCSINPEGYYEQVPLPGSSVERVRSRRSAWASPMRLSPRYNDTWGHYWSFQFRLDIGLENYEEPQIVCFPSEARRLRCGWLLDGAAGPTGYPTVSGPTAQAGYWWEQYDGVAEVPSLSTSQALELYIIAGAGQ